MSIFGRGLGCREGQQTPLLRDFTFSPHSTRFVENEESFAEHIVALQDTRLLPPYSYTCVNHDSLSTSLSDHLALSSLMFDATVFCCSFLMWPARITVPYGVTLIVQGMQTRCKLIPARLKWLTETLKTRWQRIYPSIMRDLIIKTVLPVRLHETLYFNCFSTSFSNKRAITMSRMEWTG